MHAQELVSLRHRPETNYFWCNRTIGGTWFIYLLEQNSSRNESERHEVLKNIFGSSVVQQASAPLFWNKMLVNPATCSKKLCKGPPHSQHQWKSWVKKGKEWQSGTGDLKHGRHCWYEINMSALTLSWGDWNDIHVVKFYYLFWYPSKRIISHSVSYTHTNWQYESTTRGIAISAENRPTVDFWLSISAPTFSVVVPQTNFNLHVVVVS